MYNKLLYYNPDLDETSVISEYGTVYRTSKDTCRNSIGEVADLTSLTKKGIRAYCLGLLYGHATVFDSNEVTNRWIFSVERYDWLCTVRWRNQ